MTGNMIIDGAIALLCKGGWTKEALARDKDNNALSFNSGEALCFCTLGALMRSALDAGVINDRAYLNTETIPMGNPLRDALAKIGIYIDMKYGPDYRITDINDKIFEDAGQAIEFLREAKGVTLT
jgi:hypothetical protein